jgi:hypothetical protein
MKRCRYVDPAVFLDGWEERAARIGGLDVVLFQYGRRVFQKVGHVIRSTCAGGDAYGETGEIPGLALRKIEFENSHGVAFMGANFQSIARIHRVHISSFRKVNHRFYTMRRKIRASIEMA